MSSLRTVDSVRTPGRLISMNAQLAVDFYLLTQEYVFVSAYTPQLDAGNRKSLIDSLLLQKIDYLTHQVPNKLAFKITN